jgi:hypothetical protein
MPSVYFEILSVELFNVSAAVPRGFPHTKSQVIVKYERQAGFNSGHLLLKFRFFNSSFVARLSKFHGSHKSWQQFSNGMHHSRSI